MSTQFPGTTAHSHLDQQLWSILNDSDTLLTKIEQQTKELDPPGRERFVLQLRGRIEAMNALRDRIAAPAVRIALVGNYNVGKSTLANALLGEDILPSGPLPETKYPFHLRYGNAIEIERISPNGEPPLLVRLTNKSDLKSTISEIVEEARDKELSVERIIMRFPADILRLGIELTDTPGKESIVIEQDEISARELDAADAAIVVVSEEQPSSLQLREYVRTRLPQSGHATPFLVVNKMDRVAPQDVERIREDVLSTYRGIVREDRVHFVSGRAALTETEGNGRRSTPDMDALAAALDQRFAGDAKRLVRAETAAGAATEHLRVGAECMEEIKASYGIVATRARQEEVVLRDQHARLTALIDGLRAVIRAAGVQAGVQLRAAVQEDIGDVAKAASEKARNMTPPRDVKLLDGDYEGQAQQIVQEMVAEVGVYAQKELERRLAKRYDKAVNVLGETLIQRAEEYLRKAVESSAGADAQLPPLPHIDVRAVVSSALTVPIGNATVVAGAAVVGAIFVKVAFLIGVITFPIVLPLAVLGGVALWSKLHAKLRANFQEAAAKTIYESMMSAAGRVASEADSALRENAERIGDAICAPLEQEKTKIEAAHSKVAGTANTMEAKASAVSAQASAISKEADHLRQGLASIRAEAQRLSGNTQPGA